MSYTQFVLIKAYYDPDYASNGNTALYQTKRLFVIKHFANFIWLNAIRHDVADLPANVFGMAFKNDKRQNTALGSAQASLILMNMGTSSATVEPAQAGLGSFIGSALTTQETDWELSGGISSVTLPPLSIVTLLFD